MKKIRIVLYVISASMAAVGFPAVLILLYLELVGVDVSSTFFWVASVAFCVLSILAFSLGRILVAWEEEDSEQE